MLKSNKIAPSEQIYTISLKNDQKEYFQLIGSNGQVYFYYYKEWDKDRLISKAGKDLINYNIKSLFTTAAAINYLYPSKLFNIKLYFGPKKYKIKGDYLYGKGNINWRWIPSELVSTRIILIDKNCNNQVIAKIDGFSLTREKQGILNIASGVSQDFWETIITTACIIWKRNIGHI
ncbi:hypothetical protein CONCODRAFT_72038 [Conidiobolus coronatus NRRL 28638]|uniref:Tubby C-terminal domain-containing protein n=1 Tax=Conidiobolus coronatus (strain ATCC 28846 / CBS 209.66 / NRRL 28638) TaxID=796925 RepID=A0A137P0X3_CONC2|nr:hypothetical protein CONCODRAFT_72038 [Conidiobolus coronatus NRRL 28638]|eukprot:KXN68723.1 hypothetical protein CONCODRAFT_72038 [Conidiobolus coronatus NRRL 28638]